MKKIVCLIGIFMLVFSLNAFAVDFEGAGWYEKQNGNGPEYKWFKKHPTAQSEWVYVGPELPSITKGHLKINAAVSSRGATRHGAVIPNGIAFGFNGAEGNAEGGAGGFVKNGTIDADLNIYGGGAATGGAEVFNLTGPKAPELSIGVRSYSHNIAETGGELKVKADPDPYFGFAKVGGGAHGSAAQGSFDTSIVGSSPLPMWDSFGITSGTAAQGSAGSWEGHAYAKDFGDPGCFWDSKAGAGFKADISMQGGTLSESYRYIDLFDGGKTEGMGTNVDAFTTVDTKGKDWDWEKGMFNKSGSNVNGGFIAAGGVNSQTFQVGPGVATAGAKGAYIGAGQLNTDFHGNASGGTYTGITTFNGYNGSINHAGANMSVTASNTLPKIAD